MTRVLRRQEELVERWTAAGGPGFAGRARALLLELGLEDDDLEKPTRVLLGGQRKLVVARGLPRARAGCAAARRARSPPRCRGPRAARRADARIRRRLRRCVPRPVPARRDGRRDRRAHVGEGRWTDQDVARQLLRLHGRARARALSPGAAVRHPAEGDCAARRGDPTIRGLGTPRSQRAAHQAGPEQAAPDRPHGGDRAARARTAQDRPRAPAARARRRADRRTGRRLDRPRGAHDPERCRPDRLARRTSRSRRRERRGQVGAARSARWGACTDDRRAEGRAVDSLRPSGSGPPSPRTRRRLRYSWCASRRRSPRARPSRG